MTTETSPSEPKLVVGPLALVALTAFWRGIRRRSPIALSIGIAAALVEFGSSDYRQVKRRWTVLSVSSDDPQRR